MTPHGSRHPKTEELIEKYEDAILAISTGAVQTYHLDTGQTRQSVTKMHLSQLQATGKTRARREVYSQLGCGRAHIRPAWQTTFAKHPVFNAIYRAIYRAPKPQERELEAACRRCFAAGKPVRYAYHDGEKFPGGFGFTNLP